MQNNWTEALGSVNAYVQTLATSGGPDDQVTLAAFDSNGGKLDFQILRRQVKARDWRVVTDAEASPRGMTPLFDAIGQIVAIAEKDDPRRAVIVIMTDGEENASKEINRAGAKAALDRATAKGWESVFLGVDFGRFGDADSMGISASKQVGVSAGQFSANMENLARKSRAYADSAAGAPVEFNEADRALAGEDKVKQRDQGPTQTPPRGTPPQGQPNQ
jgi:hypothetical protein